MFSTYVNSGQVTAGITFQLTSSIDLTGLTWSPIGTETNPFAGTFNGGSYNNGEVVNCTIISNITVNSLSVDNVGLFGYSTGTIENIGVVNGQICGQNNVGGIVGYSFNSGTVTGCYFTGTVTGSSNVGGIVGRCYAGTTTTPRVSKCFNIGTVSPNSGTSGSGFGGIVGWAWSESNVSNPTIKDCYNSGKVIGTTSVGGVAGINFKTIISTCYFTGNIGTTGASTDTSDIGSVVGTNSGTVNNCYYDKQMCA